MNPLPIESVRVEDLLLDPDNPRLPEDMQGKSQRDILRYIAKNEAVEDLMSAIGKNGFFGGEPLVVYRKDTDPRGKFRVIEGNRRLASVMLLKDPSLYPERPSLTEISTNSPKKNKPDELPVLKVQRRDDALPYLGSRHIVGVKSWEPLQKARYMYQLFQATKNSAASDRYREVASRIGSGSRRDYIKKNLDALAVFDVIKGADFFGDDNATEEDFNFAVLYTALDSKPIAGHVGVIKYDAKKNEAVKENDPIVNRNVLKKEKIKELYEWCFERDEGGRTVLGESRKIPKLAAVLRDEKATQVLRSSNNLDIAYEKSIGVVEELISCLSNSLTQLRYANSIVANAKYDASAYEMAKQVQQQARQICQSMSAKAEEDEE